MTRTLLTTLLAAVATGLFAQPPRERDWPAIGRDARPWTRWWWHGSAVARDELTRELDALRAVGIGGVEITPIYGVRGEERRFIPFLSGEWMDRLDGTLREAARLDLGVDMATGTGWPFGGPWVGDDHAPRSLAHRTWSLESGQQVTEPIHLRQTPLVRAPGNQIYEFGEIRPGEARPAGTSQQPQVRTDVKPLQIGDIADPVTANKNLQALALEQVKYPRDLPLVAVVAYGESGTVTDLSTRVTPDRRLDWTAPERSTIYALFAGWHGKLVERAAPGGEGNVIDHFSRDAIRAYLARFDRAFASRGRAGLRAFFNDSYEVDDASGQGDWTPRFLQEFRTRRGYDLLRHLPALFGRDTDDRNARVLADYRETVSDLLLETFTAEWDAWAGQYGNLTRNQAHGSPANLLDLYAASDIPETEGTDVPRFKWATSAANVSGKRLVAAEAATWLGEHFRTTLAEVRSAVDHFFVAGVNHIVYHGTAYSPDDDPWPGWQFYAAVEFSPQTSWWDDFAALNRYVARTQSFLQSGRADHDVLLYFPFHDAISTPGKTLLMHFGGANRPSGAGGFDVAAKKLQARGFTYDYISDRQLKEARVGRPFTGRHGEAGSPIVTGGHGEYGVLVLPALRFIPEETGQRVIALVREGATMVMAEGPEDVPGLGNLEARRARAQQLAATVQFGPPGSDGVSEARVGTGRILRAADLERALARAGIAREPMVDHGLSFARRVDDGGRFYFISNRSERAVEGWVPLQIATPAATIFDPMTGRRGRGQVLNRNISRDLAPSRSSTVEVYLQLPPGGSLIVAAAPQPNREPYEFYAPSGSATPISDPWRVSFVKGGPTLPPRRTVEQLQSWTAFEGDDVKTFAGTATYTATFRKPSGSSRVWLLDLGRVHESARVRLNGRDLGTLIAPPYRLVLADSDLRQSNTIEVSVTNLPANRIADLDRRGMRWKKFYNVNMPSRFPQNRGPDGLFTAAKWEPLDSGLIGPVALTPAKPVR
jgi:hypothetical protein